MMGTVVVLLAVLAAAMVLVRLGYVFAADRLAAGWDELDARREMLDAEWRALDDTRRIRTVFLKARQAMRTEEWRQGRR